MRLQSWAQRQAILKRWIGHALWGPSRGQEKGHHQAERGATTASRAPGNQATLDFTQDLGPQRKSEFARQWAKLPFLSPRRQHKDLMERGARLGRKRLPSL